MSDNYIIQVNNLGKMYKLYRNPKDKIFDAFGLNFFKKNYYKEFWALRDINLTINKGERVGFIGHNGAGKSTLLKIITGNINPTEGSIDVKGKIQALLEMGTGFHPEFTGRENIRASLAYQGISQKEIASLEEDIIDFTELEDYIDQPVKSYSAGMYSRLAFATASAVKPELMIIDEILGAGDAYFNGKCVERMRNLTKEEGATFLFVSHDLQSVQALCTRVIWIDKGHIRYDGEVLLGIKKYLQSVRKHEEQRLKLRDLKHARGKGELFDKAQDLYDSYLFRLVSADIFANGAKIYQIKIIAAEETVGIIDVGNAMDNQVGGECFIIDEPGQTCWGKSARDEKGYYREYNNELGCDKQAPFQIMVNKVYDRESLMIEIEAVGLQEKGITIQIYDFNECKYVDCKCIQADEQHYEIVLNELSNEKEQHSVFDNNVLDDKITEKQMDKLSFINTEEACFKNIYLRDQENNMCKVFSFDKGIKDCVMEILFQKARVNFYLVFIVYTTKGDIVFSSSQKVVLSKEEKNISIIYPFPLDAIGSGEYLISTAVYNELDPGDNSREQPFLALVDRGISFKINQPVGYAMNIGNFVLRPELKAMNGEKIYCHSLL